MLLRQETLQLLAWGPWCRSPESAFRFHRSQS